MSDVKRIGVLTGGGDAPGLNAVIRAVVKSACNAGHRVRGDQRGLRRPGRDGPVRRSARRTSPASSASAARSSARPTAATRSPTPSARPTGTRGLLGRSVLEMFHELGLDALIAIGGDGTLAIAQQLCAAGDPGRRRAQDHRQRPRRHDEHASGSTPRSRSRPMRSTACTPRPKPPPRHGRRGDGPLRRAGSPCTPAWPAAPTSS